MMEQQPLRIVELFQSLQGEGANSGRLMIFIRLAGCNLNCAFCDTSFDRVGMEWSPEQLLEEIVRRYPTCKNILWTGGEPTLQLSEEVVSFFTSAGYWQALESNGLVPSPRGLDYITLSPKVKWEKVAENYRDRVVGELRFPIAVGDTLPIIEKIPKALHYYLSPIFDGEQVVAENIRYCQQLIEQDPRWSLSLQMHKLIGIR